MSIALPALALLVLLAAAIQLLVPKLAERRVGRRLTARGGEAEVTLLARPAPILLRRRGSLLRVRGRDLEIGMSAEGGGLTALDGFERVDIMLADFVSGPFEITEFELRRERIGRPYRMRAEAMTTGGGLSDFSAPLLGQRTGSLVGMLARQTPIATRRFPVTIEIELISANGALTVAAGGGTLAGYPAGRIAAADRGRRRPPSRAALLSGHARRGHQFGRRT